MTVEHRIRRDEKGRKKNNKEIKCVTLQEIKTNNNYASSVTFLHRRSLR